MSIDVLRDGPVIVNLGLRAFADSVSMQHASVINVDWSPPHVLDARLTELLEALE